MSSIHLNSKLIQFAIVTVSGNCSDSIDAEKPLGRFNNVYMYACQFVSMWLSTYGRTYVCMHVHIYVCIHVCPSASDWLRVAPIFPDRFKGEERLR